LKLKFQNNVNFNDHINCKYQGIATGRETAIDKVCGAEMAILPTIKNAFSNQ
jgi:hypothetical protein